MVSNQTAITERSDSMAYKSKLMYEWSSGAYAKVAPEVAGAVFEELEKGKGLTAPNLVDASRPEDAPLHKEFEWDDAIAAEKYRENRARLLINHLHIRMEEVEDAPPIRAYVSLKTDDNRKYESVPMILKNPQKTTALFDMAMRELESFQRKYSNLTEFARIFEEIERLKGEN